LPSSIQFYDPYKKTPPEVDIDADTEFEWTDSECFIEYGYPVVMLMYFVTFSYSSSIE
jgi:hypothetical protein